MFNPEVVPAFLGDEGADRQRPGVFLKIELILLLVPFEDDKLTKVCM